MSSTKLRLLTLKTPIELVPPKVKAMARKSITEIDAPWINYATLLVDGFITGEFLPGVRKDINALPDADRKKVLEYSVAALFGARKDEAIAAMQARIDNANAAIKAERAKQAAKTEALSKLAQHARIRSKAKRVVKGRGK